MRQPPAKDREDTDVAPTPTEEQVTGAQPPQAAPRRSRGFSNLRVRSRLIILIVIPTAVALAFGGLRISESVTSALAYQRIEKLAQTGGATTSLVHALQAERDLTAGYVASDRKQHQAGLKNLYAKTDNAVAKFRGLASQISGAYGTTTRQHANVALSRLDDLAPLRDVASGTQMPALTIINKYSDIISDLLALDDDIAQGSADPTLGSRVRTLTALSRTKEYASQQRAILYAALTAGSIEPTELSALRSATSGKQSELAIFQASGGQDAVQLYNDTVAGPEVNRAAAVALQATERAQPGRSIHTAGLKRSQAKQWFSDTSTELGQMREVETHEVGAIVNKATSLGDAALNAAIIGGVVVFLVIILVLFLTIAIARSMTRPLRRLREGALAVAKRDLPDMVEKLRNSEPGTVDTSVEPIDVSSTDEIGQVARSFDEVHREAVRLAADEALLRGNVNAMFVNLSRRSQSLIERQLRLIDGLEQGEQDGERLGSLFKLDHLATRMRRNGENLLVLAGQDAPRRWSQPVPLVDVLRASLSEVEQYERVQLQVQPGFSVVGQAVNDIVHLVAELVENATTFSPQDTRVSLNAQPLSGGGVMLDITDNGIGMPPEECAEVNRRLAEPPVVDVSVSRRMGLFVVGRLATRHGIRVQLRPGASGGLTVLALLPDSIVTRSVAGGPGRPGRDLDSQLAAAGLAGGAPESPPVGFPGMANGSRPDGLPALGAGDQAAPAGFSGQSGAMPTDSADHGSGAYPVQRPGDRDDRFGASTGSFAAQELPHGIGGGLGSGSGGGFGGEQYEQLRPMDDPGRMNGRPGAISGTSAMDAVRPASPAPAQPAPQPPAAPAAPAGPPADHAQAQHASEPAGEPGGGDTGDWPVMRTGPDSGAFPVVSDRNSANTEERSPIFDAIESEWFRRSGSRPGSAGSGGAAPGGGTGDNGGAARAPAASTTDSGGWRSPGDEGWQAAAAASRPTSGGTTTSGLPKRVPRANLVPGAAGARRPAPGGPGGPGPQAPATPVPAAPRSADQVRSRMSSFQQGVRNARAASRDEGPEDES